MTITALPSAPSRSDPPATFIAKADAFIAALPGFVSELNAFAAALDNFATTSTSDTSLTISTGNQALTVDTGKSYQVGMTVKIASNTSPSNWMIGDVVSYTSGTGALTVNVTNTQGSGSAAAWTVTMSAPGGATLGSNTYSGPQNEAQGDDVAATSTLNLDAATGNLVDVTGAATITAITLAQGAERVVRFTGACTLANGASLVLPGGANITTASGDFMTFRGYASGVVRCTGYTPARGNDAFPAGTKLVFAQAAAPSGWTQDASNDRVLRVVSGAGGGTGGSLSITSSATGSHVLTAAQMPSHNHSGSSASDSGHTHALTTSGWQSTGSTHAILATGGSAGELRGSTPGDGSPTGSGSANINLNIASQGGNAAHDHSLAIKYQDVIVCAKN